MPCMRIMLVGLLAAALTAGHRANANQVLALADLSFEELSELEITSVSRKPERLADAPASVFVITAEDIRRSGARSLPEALALAPNLHVARNNGVGYSISARGFNNSSGNKLLVLLDGRSVYTPLFSGVFWDVQDMLLEDVERIEVISGPGGTLWGVNAVNGVINVISRSSTNTQGTLVVADAATNGSGLSVRRGGQVGRQAHGAPSYRLYARYADLQGSETADGRDIRDEGFFKRAGFRMDADASADAPWLVSGEVYEGRRGQPAPGTFTLSGVVRPLNDVTLSGGHVLGKWSRRLAEQGVLEVQAYYDRTYRKVPGTFVDTLEVLDLQLQHAWVPREGHALAWGLEWRHGSNHVEPTDFAAFVPNEVRQRTYALFVQDVMTLSEALQLTLGARLERNDYTGSEFLPNARLAWKPGSDHLVWAAASRTLRAPSRLDRDLLLTGPGVVLTGGQDFRSEQATVYEVGYRGRIAPDVNWSVTAYRTDYDHLRTYELDTTRSAPAVVYLGNLMEGSTLGLETWATYQVSDRWRLMAGATFQDKNLRLKSGSWGLNGGPAAEGNDPSATWQLRSTFNAGDRWEFDAMLRHVARLPKPEVPAYTVLDVRVGWRPASWLDLSLGMQNLLDKEHAEFGSPATRAEFGSTLFVRAVARF